MRKRKKNRIVWLIVTLVLVVGIFLVLSDGSEENTHATELMELPDGFQSYGIDVSHYQKEINWSSVKESMDSLDFFVYCKVTEGLSLVDERWEENHHHLDEEKIKHGAYHFFRPGQSATWQAKHFMNHYTYDPGHLPPVLDAEVEGISNEFLINGMKNWLERIENQWHVRPIIYTSWSFYKNKFKGKFPGYKFWIARYGDEGEWLDDPNIIHWQYSDNGRVAGIEEPVDLNISKEHFN